MNPTEQMVVNWVRDAQELGLEPVMMIAVRGSEYAKLYASGLIGKEMACHIMEKTIGSLRGGKVLSPGPSMRIPH